VHRHMVQRREQEKDSGYIQEASALVYQISGSCTSVSRSVQSSVIEKLDCVLSKRATRPHLYESTRTAECHQPVSESTVISGHPRHHHLRPYKTPFSAIRDSSPAETYIRNTKA